MGFECGFNFIPKLDDTRNDLVNFNRFNYVVEYISYKGSEWLKDTYASFKEYCEHNDQINFDGIPADEDIETVRYYLDTFNIDKYDDYRYTIDYWCSDGRDLDDFMLEKVEFIDDDRLNAIITNELLVKIEEFVDRHDDEYLKPVSVLKSFTSSEDDDGNEIIISRSADGVEVGDREGSFKRVYLEEDELFFGDMVRDRLLNRVKSFLDKARLIDKNKYIVYYWRSY